MSDIQTKINFTREESLGNIGTLRVTKELQQLIDKLHCTIGAVEWSGILFYKLTKGNLKNLKNLEFTASFLYPMNIGSHTYTEFEYNGEITGAYDLYETGIESNTGLVHSHNSFNTFFSGTDQAELKDNASQYNFYVSLIVNFDHKYCAKIAFPSKTNVTSEYWIKDENGKLFKKKSVKEETTVLIGDLNVIIEDDTISLPWLEKRIEVLENKKKSFNNIEYPESSLPRYHTPKKFNNYYTTLDTTPYPTSLELPKNKVNNKTRSQEFLSVLLNQNFSKIDDDIRETLVKLSKLSKDELDEYESILDSNIEIIHQNVYSIDDSFQLKKHCLEALLELSNYDIEFGETDIYQIITQSLSIYAI